MYFNTLNSYNMKYQLKIFNVDESGLNIEKYCKLQPRYGFSEKPSQKTIENDRHMLYKYIYWLLDNDWYCFLTLGWKKGSELNTDTTQKQ